MIISVTHIKTSVTQLRLENVYRQTDLRNVDTDVCMYVTYDIVYVRKFSLPVHIFQAELCDRSFDMCD